MADAVCGRCRRGEHSHDRHTGKITGSTPGDDAGCPWAVNGGDQCACTVVVGRDGKPQPEATVHPIGPGQPPNPRDEPIANAIWFALVRVRDAFDWADVARDVEEQLRSRGIVTPAHDRLREAEREREEFRVQNNSLRAQWAAKEARQGERGCMERVKGRCSTHNASWTGSELTGCDAVADPVQGYLDRLRSMDPSPRMLAHIEEIEAERTGRG